jgi:hypothetical protein
VFLHDEGDLFVFSTLPGGAVSYAPAWTPQISTRPPTLE